VLALDGAVAFYVVAADLTYGRQQLPDRIWAPRKLLLAVTTTFSKKIHTVLF
jgi:hypothetical protein